MKHNVLYVIIFFLISIIGFLYSEKIAVNQGAGWDGSIYVEYSRNLPSAISEHKIDQYYFQRILPCTVVYGIAQGVSIFAGQEYAFSIPVIIKIFYVLNILALLICVFVLGRLCDFLGYDAKRKVLIMIFFFLNFFILKMTFYYPVLTDIPALLVAVLLTDLWFRKKEFLIFVLGIAGYFVFPGLFEMSILLWLAPRHNNTETTKHDSLKWWWVSGVSCVTVVMVYFCLTSGVEVIFDLNKTNTLLLIPSIACTWLYLFLILSHLKLTAIITKAWTMMPWKKVGIALIVFLLIRILIAVLIQPKAGYDFREFIHVISYNAFTNPFIYLVAHNVYFGIIVLFIIVYFKDFVRKINLYGGGLLWVTIGFLFFSINSESRQLLIFFPIVVVIMADVAASAGWAKTIPMIVLVAVNVLFSKCWLSFHENEWGNVHELPAQYYFMNHGPWMNNEMYYLQGGIFITALLLLWWSRKKYFSALHQ